MLYSCNDSNWKKDYVWAAPKPKSIISTGSNQNLHSSQVGRITPKQVFFIPLSHQVGGFLNCKPAQSTSEIP